MCGFFGVINISGKVVDKNRAIESLSLLYHRGPDEQHYYSDLDVFLGHTRLSIVGDDEFSSQPMIDDRDNILCYNGEIYNYLEVKEKLIEQGVEFKGSSDSEVFLKAYGLWGSDFTEHLDGCYSALVYNKSNHEVFIIRDHFGIKPLYYFIDDYHFIVSSEIKPILHYEKSCQRINSRAIHSILKYRYNIYDESPFRGVKSVAPGSHLKFQTDLHPRNLQVSPNKELIVEPRTFSESFMESVALRIPTLDFNILLSGGIDSSAIYLAVKRLKCRSSQIVYRFTHKDIDESQVAQRLCEKYGDKIRTVEHEEVGLEDYRRALFHLEEPLCDSIIVPTMRLAQSVQGKVVLSGEGADEILNGYIHHQTLLKQYFLIKYFGIVAKILIYIGALLCPDFIFHMLFKYKAKLSQQDLAKLRKHLRSVFDYETHLESLISVFSNDEISRLLQRNIAKSDKLLSYFKENLPLAPENSLTKTDLRFWNNKYTLLRLDRLFMANSVEARVPFLSQVVLTSLKNQNISLKERAFSSKNILRKVIKEGFHEEQLAKRQKQAFFFPIEREFNLKKAFDKLENKLFEIDAGELEKMISENELSFLGQKKNFVLISLLLWHEVFFANDLLELYWTYYDPKLFTATESVTQV